MLIKIIVFICGAVVMSFEILGSRVLAPNFGNSIFVWGSLISTFLAGLSAGYYWGGKIADLNPSIRKLGLIITVPGLLLVAFPLYGTVVSDWIFTKDPGIRLGPLLASITLFFIPSVFLGAISPYTTKITSRQKLFSVMESLYLTGDMSTSSFITYLMLYAFHRNLTELS